MDVVVDFVLIAKGNYYEVLRQAIISPGVYFFVFLNSMAAVWRLDCKRVRIELGNDLLGFSKDKIMMSNEDRKLCFK